MPIRSSLAATFVFEEPRCNFAAGYLEMMGRLAEREGEADEDRRGREAVGGKKLDIGTHPLRYEPLL